MEGTLKGELAASDVTVVLGCVSGEASSQMAQQVQGFLTMLRMAGGQSADVPTFLTVML